MPELISAALLFVWVSMPKKSRKHWKICFPAARPFYWTVKIQRLFLQLITIIWKNSSRKIWMPTTGKMRCRKASPKKQLKETLGRTISPKLFNMALRSLSKSETIVTDKDNVRLAGHEVQTGGELDSLRGTIAEKYRKAGLNVPSLSDVITDFKDQKTKAQSIIKLMLKDGELIKINEELCFDRDTLNKLREDYKALLIKDGKATPASLKN